MRNARLEARQRVDGRYEVRVLEPSPPVNNEPPFFADDPVAGGDVVPVVRADGSRTWEDISTGDTALREWCEERWLVRRPLAPLPDGFAEARRALHAVAEHEIAPARQAANGKIGLRFTFRGFGTPFFGADRQVRVEGDALIDTSGELSRTLDVDAACSYALGDWYGYCASLLEQVRADADPVVDTPSRVQIWPEHFDMAVDLGPDGRRANYGGSPGDDGHAEPYLYVGPWESRTGTDAFWNEGFGASLGYRDILAGADGLAFLRRGRELLRT